MSKTNGNGTASGVATEPRFQVPKKVIEVPNYTIGVCEIEIIGGAPLLVHQFSEKARRAIEWKQQKGVSLPREKRNPVDDFFGGMYIISGDPRKDIKVTEDKAEAAYVAEEKPSKKCKAVHGIPASGFKRAMVRASKAAGAKMTDTMCGFFIIGHDHSQMVKLDFDHIVLHSAAVRLETGVCDIRYRPEYHGWSTVLRIEYDAKSMPLAQIVNLVRRAGRFIGWGEDRPEKGGSHGRFYVGEVRDLGEVNE